MPRRRRQRRGTGPRHSRPPGGPHQRTAGHADPQRTAGAGNAAEPDQRRRNGAAHALPAQPAAAQLSPPAWCARSSPPPTARRSTAKCCNQGFDDLQLRTDDKRVHLLRRAGDKFREVTSSSDWPGYNGDPGGNRYTTLRRSPRPTSRAWDRKWIFTLPNAGAPAGDAGRRGRHHVRLRRQRVLRARRRQRPRDLALPARRARAGCLPTPWAAPIAAWPSRAIASSWSTDNAHLIALNRFTGELVWDTEMADWHQNYFATSAPLAVGQPGGRRHGRRRARRARLRRRLRSGDRQGSLALLDRAEARRAAARKPGRARASSTAARPPGSPAPTTRRSDTRLLADRQSRAPNTTATTARATTSIPTASSRSMPRPASSSGTTSSRRTTCGIGMPRKRRWCVDAALAGPAAQAAAAGQSQRLLLRLRPHRRQAAARQAVRHAI